MSQILVLLLLSGGIAFLGDRIGSRIGRKRLSIFGMRPKKTAVLITIMTGMGITVVTIFTFALLNNNVWDAIFNVPKLKARIKKIESQVNDLNQIRTTLETDIKKLEKENKALIEEMSGSRAKIDALTKEKESIAAENAKNLELIDTSRRELTKLKEDSSKLRLEITDLEDELKRKSEGKVVFLKDTPILTAVLKPTPDWKGILSQIKQALYETRNEAVRRGAVAKEFKQFWADNEAAFTKIAKQYHIQNMELAFGLLASINIYKGDKLDISIKAAPKRLISKKGDSLLPADLNTILPASQKDETNYERQLIYFYRRACTELYKKGRVQVMPELKPQALVSAVNELMSAKGDTKIEVVATEDVYTAGPGKIGFVITDISEFMDDMKSEVRLEKKYEGPTIDE
jgi:cell division protein FtsB